MKCLENIVQMLLLHVDLLDLFEMVLWKHFLLISWMLFHASEYTTVTCNSKRPDAKQSVVVIVKSKNALGTLKSLIHWMPAWPQTFSAIRSKHSWTTRVTASDSWSSTVWTCLDFSHLLVIYLHTRKELWTTLYHWPLAWIWQEAWRPIPTKGSFKYSWCFDYD